MTDIDRERHTQAHTETERSRFKNADIGEDTDRHTNT